MTSEKLSPQLAETLQDPNSDDSVDLIVELNDPTQARPADAPRAMRIAARKQAFSQYSEKVTGRIRTLGGEVTGAAWINSTMSVRIPKKMVPALSEVPQVKRLDVPHKLHQDAHE